ncbi:MAG: hypothetical protein ABW039_10465 [Sphingobium sp.]
MKSAQPETNQSGQTMGSKGLRTRRKLIDTTVALLESTTIRELKVVDIAQAAATSAATFYVYFDNVIDVVLAATEELSQSTPELVAIVNDAWDDCNSLERASAFVKAYVAFWDRHRPLMRTRNLAAEEGDMRFTATRELSIRPLMAAMVKKIDQSQREGRIHSAIFPYASAGTLLMMLERLGALAHIYDGETVSFAQMETAAAYMVAATFGWPVRDTTQQPANAQA